MCIFIFIFGHAFRHTLNRLRNPANITRRGIRKLFEVIGKVLQIIVQVFGRLDLLLKGIDLVLQLLLFFLLFDVELLLNIQFVLIFLK